MSTLKQLDRALEDRFNDINAKIFQLESQFPVGHRTRLALYRTRIELGKATAMNRENKDVPQNTIVFIQEVPGEVPKE